VQFSGHKKSVNEIDFSSNDRYIVSASSDETIKLWDTNTGKELKSFTGHTSDVNSVCFSSDARYIVSASDDKTIKLWDVKTGKLLQTLKGHTDAVKSINLSSDDKYIVSISSGLPTNDNTVKFWKIQTGELLASLVNMSNTENDWIVYTPEGKYDGKNCSKYLHYVEGMEVSLLPENDPNYVPGLLRKILNEGM